MGQKEKVQRGKEDNRESQDSATQEQKNHHRISTEEIQKEPRK